MTNARWQRWLVAWHGVLVLVWLQGFWQRSVPLALAGLVAARRYKAATHGVEPLRELQAEVQRQGARAGVYVALQGAVSEQARGFARDNALALLEGDALATLLLKATPPKT